MMQIEPTLVRKWIAATLLGESVSYSVKGTREQLLSLSEALVATHVLDTQLTGESSSVDSVMNALNRKHLAVKRFEKAYGFAWPV